MWAMFPTILLATNDVRLRDPGIERILLNAETIAVNRAPPPALCRYPIATPVRGSIFSDAPPRWDANRISPCPRRPHRRTARALTGR
jgi:hypothetical protein